MFSQPTIDPIAFHIWRLPVHWYGLMYLMGFIVFSLLGRWRIAHRPGIITVRDLDDMVFFGAIGVVLGGRLGYALFYQSDKYLHHPIELLYVWQGGMSFHGGLIGVIVAMIWFARSRSLDFLDLMDFVAPLVPTGLAFGRLGNFINGELWGRPTDVPWGMHFRDAPGTAARHPSQIYELLLEGVLLFVILWIYSSRPRPRGAVAALFLIGYGCVRFGVEFTREPDSYLGLLWFGLSMGQWLSIPMILLGLWVFWRAHRNAIPS